MVVGARSAIFAPTPHLGLIVLDEEHESTFKQESAPRYHARDVALRRAADQNVPLVLASATPSLESWQRAQRGEYQLVELPRRVLDRPLPAVRTIDLRDEVHSKRSRGAISRPLHQAMDEALRDGGQVILLLNRRGFSTHIQCPACGHVGALPALRPGADVSSARAARPCATTAIIRLPAPHDVPRVQVRRHSLQRPGHAEAGSGSAGPVSRLSRACGWTPTACSSRGSHEQALTAFRDGQVRILLGTQMIAKGLDFPNVTLVGVINADTALHLPDFRAAERTFQLVTQVAGRTGRGPKGGRVLVQTLQPEHAGDPGGGAARLCRRSPRRSCRIARRSAIRRSRRWCGSWSAARAKRRRKALADEIGAAAASEVATARRRRCACWARRRRRWPSCAAISLSDSAAVARWRAAAERRPRGDGGSEAAGGASPGPSTSIRWT